MPKLMRYSCSAQTGRSVVFNYYKKGEGGWKQGREVGLPGVGGIGGGKMQTTVIEQQ